jgi:phosphoglycerate dehydrogenase-like enzyme
MRVLITDYDFKDLDLELRIFKEGAIEVATAQCKTEDDVIRAAHGCSALLVQYAPVTDHVLAASPQIGMVSRLGAGFDTVDPAACEKHGVWLANSPDYGVGEVATHALAMALALLRHLPFYDRDVKAGNWHYLSAGPIGRASNMTLGILGLGRIGKRMAHIGRNVFKRVIACDPYIIDGDFPAYVERVTLDELFAQSDALSLHVPLTAETRGMVNGRLLDLMPSASVLINTARGAVINIDDLLKILAEAKLDGVALDVLPVEPVPDGHPLATHPRVLLTPHAAFYSIEAEIELRCKAAQNVVSWAQRGRPDYPIVKGSKLPS